MSPQRLEHLLKMVGPVIQKEDTTFRKSISAEQRLVITLRFLATGVAQQSLSFEYRVGKSTVCNIISETSKAIYECLKEEYLKAPSKKEEWLSISKDFEDIWNLPHCLGAMDGKHVRLQCPKLSGSNYYNYKGFYSIVLLAICDAKYCFILHDTGQFGSNNDSGVLANSGIVEIVEENKLDIPSPSAYKSCAYNPLPYFFVGDEIFPLKTWLMRPFPGKLTELQRSFDYRLSRARRTIENAFGILAARWQIFHTPMRANIENAENYTLACLALHNYLRLTENALYCPSGFVDSVDDTGRIKEGDWRSIVQSSSTHFGITNISNVRGSRYSDEAVNMRDALMNYLNSEEGAVPWQTEHIRRTSY